MSIEQTNPVPILNQNRKVCPYFGQSSQTLFVHAQ